MPAAFLGHGTPMNALGHNRYTESWRAFGASIQRPRGIVVISAHWYIHATALTAMERPQTIHDFFGFPEELFAMQYPAPGDPSLAAEVADIVAPVWAGLDHDSWGLDHGTWSVLCHVFPEADIPVVQLSINAMKPFEYHLDLGARLAPLRERDVLVIASGNVVHNLHLLDPSLEHGGFDWAHRFDDAVREVMTTAPGSLANLAGHAEYKYAVPTPDHFIPLLYLAGLADAAGHGTNVLVDGYALGSLSMTGYVLDAPSPNGAAHMTTDDVVPLPDPERTPPDETNL